MERLNGYVVKVHLAWLASSMNCCFPTLQEHSVRGKRDSEDKLEKATASRRNSPLPTSKYNTTTTVTTQPQPQEPPTVHAPHIIEEHPKYRESRRVSKQAARTTWYGEEHERARRASKQCRISTEVRRSMSRKHSLSGRNPNKQPQAKEELEEPVPVCVSPIPELPPFRPLHLSIHSPGNELPRLPKFSDDIDDADDIPAVPEIPRPPEALLVAKPETVLMRTSSRKTTANNKSSMDDVRCSTDTEMTMVEVSFRQRTSSLSYARFRSHSSASTRSNQDFVEMLNNPLPTLPKQYLLTSKYSKDELKKKDKDKEEEGKPTLVRNASDQNKRLQTHLQERQEVGMASPDCSTIAEEKSPVTPIISSPYPSRKAPMKGRVQGLALIPAIPDAGILSSNPSASLAQPTPASNFRSPSPLPTVSGTITDFTTFDPIFTVKDNTSSTDPVIPPSTTSQAYTSTNHHRARSFSGSSTLLNRTISISPTPDLYSRPNTAEPLGKPLVTTTGAAPRLKNEKPGLDAIGKRLTQWLTRSEPLSNKESVRPLEAERRDIAARESGADFGGTWFSDRDSTLMSTGKEKTAFGVSAIATEIGLGELLDQKLGVVHPPAAAEVWLEERPAMQPRSTSVERLGVNGLEEKVEKACGIARSRSATETTFVGTERGASVDLKRMVTDEQEGMGMGMGMMTVGIAM